MFKEIYDFAKQQNVSIDKRFKDKYIKYHICIDEQGNFIQIEINTDKKNKVSSPTYPDRALYGNISNPIVSNVDVLFSKENKKNNSYISFIEEVYSQSEEMLSIYNFIKNIDNWVENINQYSDEIVNDINAFLKDKKELFSFKINENYIENLTFWHSYYNRKYNEIYENLKEDNNNETISCITGNKIIPIRNADKITVSGITTGTGDVIICCDKPSFSSYGLRDAYNASISEEESKIISDGLTYLLSDKHFNKTFGLVHWCKDITKKDYIDLISDANDFFGEDFSDIDYSELNNFKNEKENKDIKEYKLNKAINAFFQYSKNNDGNYLPDDTEYYMFNYKPCSGRIAFSDFRIASYNDIVDNIKSFYEDSKLTKNYWFTDVNSNTKKCKQSISFLSNAYAIFASLISNNDSHTVSKDINDELSNIKIPFFNSVINNKQIPTIMFYRALTNIQKNMVNGQKPNLTLLKLIKVYILRENRTKGDEEKIMQELNINYKSIGYNLGRLLNAYEHIQKEALGNINASIVDKYYRTCSTTPAFAFGKLSTMSIYHLSKIEKSNYGRAIYYKKTLEEIINNIPKFPKKLSPIEQGNFILGYYQQDQYFYTPKNNENNEKEMEK